MAFLSKFGNILRQTANKQSRSELSLFKPSIYQAIRCMTSGQNSKIFVGGISFQTDEQSFRQEFAKYGQVVDARIITDRETGRSRGFGFVTYTSSEEASSAIQALDGQDLDGRRVRVNYATDRPRNNFGGGGFGGDGGYGGGGYGGGGGFGGDSYGGNTGGGGGYGGGSYGGNTGGGGGYGGGSYGGNTGGGGGYGGGSYGGNTGGGYGGSGVGNTFESTGPIDNFGPGSVDGAENSFSLGNEVGNSFTPDDNMPLEEKYPEADAEFEKRA